MYLAECIILIFYNMDICQKFHSHEKEIRVVKNRYEFLSNPVLKGYDRSHPSLIRLKIILGSYKRTFVSKRKKATISIPRHFIRIVPF